MSADANELSRRRREARQKRILARGTDRLSRIRQTLTRVSDLSSDQEEHSSPAATPQPTAPHSAAPTADGESGTSHDRCEPPIEASAGAPARQPPRPQRPVQREPLEPVVPRPAQTPPPAVPVPAVRTAQVSWRVQWLPWLRFCAGLLPTLALFAYALFVEWANDAVLDYWDTPSKLGLLLVEPPSAVLGDWTHAFPLAWYGLGLQVLWYAGQRLAPSASTHTPAAPPSSILAN
ncbi:hypothetical protein H4R35_007572, partial [Dimargaris xerosporica]